MPHPLRLIVSHDPLPREIHGAILEGLSAGVGGEVIVRGQDGVGRIYLHKERVAWVSSTAEKQRLTSLLAERGLVSTEVMAEVLRECQRTHANFAEMLLAWGVVEPEPLRACLLEHNALQLAAVARLSPPLGVIFIPEARTYGSELLFSYRELSDFMERAASSSPTPRSTVSFDVILEEARRRLPDCFALLCVDPTVPELHAAAPMSAAELLDASTSDGLGQLFHPWRRAAQRALEGAAAQMAAPGSDVLTVCGIGDDVLFVAMRRPPRLDRALVALLTNPARLGQTLATLGRELAQLCG